jgi:formate/nitrite transporter FocA (FNT family)
LYLIPLGLFIKTWGLATLPSGLSATIPDLGSLTWTNFAWSLPVTLGTLVGGAGLVGAVYWFVNLRLQGRA